MLCEDECVQIRCEKTSYCIFGITHDWFFVHIE